MTFDQVLQYMTINRNDLPKNIVLSNLSLIEDIKNSSYALYRGTTAIIEAIYSGVFPIYFSSGEAMAIDFLEGVSSERGIVYSVDSFVELMNAAVPNDSSNLINFCNQYFQPLEYEALLQELKGVV